MGKCFVIQPFDKGAYDKRYEDVFVPAITNAGLEPYRVDRDPSAIIPIDTIEARIRESDACLADITSDNPNVWFEVGYAIASGKSPVLVCSEEHDCIFPFDVQHRGIIQYKHESTRDFQALMDQITARLKAVVVKERGLKSIASLSPVKDTEGLSPHEIAALVVVMENRLIPGANVSPHSIKQDMIRYGYTDIAVSLTLETLLRKDMIRPVTECSYNGEPYDAYSISDKGVEWLLANQDRLVMRREDPLAPPGAPF